MEPEFKNVSERSKPLPLPAKPPSLVDLCVRATIDNIRYLGNVGDVDTHLLERILPHCTIEQLMHVENETVGRDLSQATDKLWKKFYEAVFGTQHTNDVVEKMKMCKRKFLWRQLYQAKLMVQCDPQNRSLERFTQLHKKEDERRKQLRICIKAPTSGKRRCLNIGLGVGSNRPNVKSIIMKKPKMESFNSDEFSNNIGLMRNVVQKSVLLWSQSQTFHLTSHTVIDGGHIQASDAICQTSHEETSKYCCLFYSWSYEGSLRNSVS